MQEVKVSFSADTSKFQNGVKNVNSGLSNIRSSIGNTTKIVAGLGAALAGFAAYKIVGGFKELVTSSSDVAAGFETAGIQLEVLLGSADRANKILGELRDYGANTPLEFADLMESTKILANFKVQADDLIPTLKMLGDISMGDSDKLKSLATVYGQVFANQKLQGQDNLQFINAGYNPLADISKNLGISMAEVRDRMSKGQIGIDLLNDAMFSATSSGGAFHNMLGRIADTTEGKISNFKDNITNLKAALGGKLNIGVKEALDVANEFLSKMQSTFESIGSKLGQVVKGIVDMISPHLENFQKMIDGGDSITSSIGKTIGSILSDPALINGLNTLVKETIKSLWGGLSDETKSNAIKGAAAGSVVFLPRLMRTFSLLRDVVIGISAAIKGINLVALTTTIAPLTLHLAALAAAAYTVYTVFTEFYKIGEKIARSVVKEPKDVKVTSDEEFAKKKSAAEKFEADKELARQGKYDLANSEYTGAKLKIITGLVRGSTVRTPEQIAADEEHEKAVRKHMEERNKAGVADAAKQIANAKKTKEIYDSLGKNHDSAVKALDEYDRKFALRKKKDAEKKNLWEEFKKSLPSLDMLMPAHQLTSLAAIGGAKAYTGTSTIDLQKEANNYLKAITKNTAKKNQATFA